MKFTEFIQNEIFNKRLQNHSCLAVYDPERRYREVCLEMASGKIAVVDATESSLESRRAALDALGKLGEPNSPLEGLLVYIPARKPVDEQEKMVDPFAVYAAAGACFPEKTGDEFLQLCLNFKSGYEAEIRQLFKENSQPSFAMIDAIGGGVNFPQLRAILGVESAREMLLALLAPNEKQKESLKTQNGWDAEVRQLVENSLKYNLKTKAKTQAAIADELWRFVLFSEFAFDLPQELPADLRSVPRAPEEILWFVEDLCESLRNDLKKQAVYLEKAVEVERELNLPAICEGIEDLGEKDTFAFEERSFLNRAKTGIKENDFAMTRQMLARHERSVWRGRGETQTLWALVKAALELIETCDDCEERLAENSRSQTALIDFYVGTLRTADRLQREFEQSVSNLVAPSDLMREIIRQARSRYARLSEKAQTVFVKHLETEGWTPSGKLANAEVFDRFVGERLKDHGSRVAFFMVDALRYELGVELEKLIAEDNPVETHTAFAQLPTVTVVGMASLLPGAKADLTLECASGNLVPRLAGAPVTNVAQRMDVLRKKFGDRFEETTLSKLVNQKPKIASTVNLLVLRSTEIDSQLENNPETTLGLIPQTLQYIRAALHKLRSLGFTEAVIAADHGFFLNTQAEAGDVCKKPAGGNWQICAHDRIWFGEGGSDDSNLVLPAEKLGLRGDFSKAAVPRSMAPYRAGYLYFHGGASLQEAIVPVLVVKLQPVQKFKEAKVEVAISYKNGAKKITTEVPVIEVEFHSEDLFVQQVEALIEAYDDQGNVVGRPGTGGDINPATQTVTLTKGSRMQIVLRMASDFEGKFTVKALNPTTRAGYGSLNLQTDYIR